MSQFTYVVYSNTATDDVTNKITHRIFNTNSKLIRNIAALAVFNTI